MYEIVKTTLIFDPLYPGEHLECTGIAIQISVGQSVLNNKDEEKDVWFNAFFIDEIRISMLHNSQRIQV